MVRNCCHGWGTERSNGSGQTLPSPQSRQLWLKIFSKACSSWQDTTAWTQGQWGACKGRCGYGEPECSRNEEGEMTEVSQQAEGCEHNQVQILFWKNFYLWRDQQSLQQLILDGPLSVADVNPSISISPSPRLPWRRWCRECWAARVRNDWLFSLVLVYRSTPMFIITFWPSVWYSGWLEDVSRRQLCLPTGFEAGPHCQTAQDLLRE